MILFAAVLNLIWIVILALLIKRNISRFKNKNNNGILINAEVIKWKVLSGRPTRYILDIEYQMENVKQSKRLITSGSFARKYEKEKTVPIIVLHNTNRVYFEEENWKRQNIFLFILIIMSLPFLILLLFCSSLEIIKYMQHFLF